MSKRTVDWSKFSLDEMVWYLEIKYQYLSSPDAICINKLIEYYKKQKNGKNIINKD